MYHYYYLLIYSDWSDLYQAPLRVSKSVSSPTIFRFRFISVPVFYQKVFEFLVKISQLWSHVTSRWLATVVGIYNRHMLWQGVSNG